MVQDVFQRYEKKYLLKEEEYQSIREYLRQYMEEDQYGLHTIRNIYYDTENDELIRTSMEKPKYKEKFRVRCYGEPEEGSSIFLEIKKKYDGVVNKRRIVMTKDEAQVYLESGKMPVEKSQILREVDYILHHYQLKPKLYLAYDRIALFGKEDPGFRVTFDQNIRSRNTNLRLENDQDTTRLLEGGRYLMEVKISHAMPLWFVAALSELRIQSVSFSKYGNVYKNNLRNQYYSYARIPEMVREHNRTQQSGRVFGQTAVQI